MQEKLSIFSEFLAAIHPAHCTGNRRKKGSKVTTFVQHCKIKKLVKKEAKVFVDNSTFSPSVFQPNFFLGMQGQNWRCLPLLVIKNLKL
jgi:hypothetical protein